MTRLCLTDRAAGTVNGRMATWCSEQVQMVAHNLAETELLVLKENSNNKKTSVCLFVEMIRI